MLSADLQWIVLGTTAVLGALVAFAARAVVHARRRPIATGIEWLVGRCGVAASDLPPEETGTVRVDGELWTAVAADGPIVEGDEVQVVRVDGVTLHVIRR
jgi:membrane-bound serine protease (ClpP class)